MKSNNKIRLISLVAHSKPNVVLLLMDEQSYPLGMLGIPGQESPHPVN